MEILKGSTNGCIIIAVFPNTQSLTNIESTEYVRVDGWSRNGYVWSVESGWFAYEYKKRAIAGEKSFSKAGDVAKVKVNWNDSMLHIIVNGNDLGNCDSTLYKQKIDEDEDEDIEYILGIFVMPNDEFKIRVEATY